MNHANPEGELLGLERQFWDAMKRRDVEAAAALTDFPCLVSGAQGIAAVDAPTFTRMMTDAKYTIDEVALSDDAQVRFLGDDVAVIAYRVHEEVTVDGRPLALDAAESSTWVRRDGRWVCALHAEALNGDPWGRDRVGGLRAEPAGLSDDIGDAAAIRALVARWERAAEAHDVPTLLTLFTEDVVFQVPGEPPFGKDEYAAFTSGVRAQRVRTTSSEIEELVVDCDFAFCRTHRVVEITPPGEATVRKAGHGLTIFQRGDDRQWRIARDCSTQLEVATGV